MSTQPLKDVQTVTPAGASVAPLIAGVCFRPAVTQTDERGTLTEILSPQWGFHPEPITSVYQFTIRPGMIKGWHVHHLHDDRIFFSQGSMKVVLYDDRPASPTYRMVNEIYHDEYHRGIMVIPARVFHAHQNIGGNDALMVSMPTRLYDHADPDVYRLPLDTDQIPYRFETRRGW